MTGSKGTVCAINLSGSSLGDEGLHRFIRERLSHHQVPPPAVCFEVTETSAISNLNNALQFMSTMRRLGCRFALDDFGSGLSSFGYLKNLPVDYVKVDGGFVKDMLADPTSERMVAAINNISHVMGLKTIAEFVENQAIADRLREMGVDYAQGWGMGRPQRLEDLMNLNPQRALG